MTLMVTTGTTGTMHSRCEVVSLLLLPPPLLVQSHLRALWPSRAAGATRRRPFRQSPSWHTRVFPLSERLTD